MNATETAARFTPDHIRSIRKALDLSQERFAEVVGVARITVQKWEAGERKPTSFAMINTLILAEKRAGLT